MSSIRGQPVLLAVDDDPSALGRIEAELGRRYGADYRVLCHGSPSAALEALHELKASGGDVAVVLADQWMRGMTGADLLARVNDVYPAARRGLLIEWRAWAEEPTAEAILRAMALGSIDYYVIKPLRSPDEFFHRTVAEFLHEWARSENVGPRGLVVVGESGSRRAHELRDLLARNGVPHVFHASDSPEGRGFLEERGMDGSSLPFVVLLDGRVLVDPSNAELAEAHGVSTELKGRHDFDVVVVGGGPAGLAAAVYASSEGLRTLVVEDEAIGGQAGSSALIRNYLGFSRGVTGAELAQRAYQQAWVFGTRFLLMRRVTALRAEGERHVVAISDGAEATARAVVLATGVSYRRLDVPSLEALSGTGVFYGASMSEARTLEGADVYVVGGGNSSGQAAMHLCRYARRVTLVVRGASLGEGMSQYLEEEIAAARKIDVRLETEVVDGGGAGRLEHVTLRDRASGSTSTVEAAALFVMIGARPHTDWLPSSVERDDRGYVVTGTDLGGEGGASAGAGQRAPLMLESSLPGVFAVGDVRHRSVKRVASAVGEGSVVIQQVQELLAAARGRGAGMPAERLAGLP